MKILSSVTYIARSKQNQKHQIFFKTFKAMKQNHFWSSTRTQSNNNHFYYVHTDYCNTFNGVCTDLNIYMHILSVIPNLCSFFQNLKIVTHLLTKKEHFYMLSIAITMCESEVALEYFWTSSHILEVTIRCHYLFYIAETPEHLLKIKIEFEPSISLHVHT